ncbi:MAG TPA: rhodanese-like domain-containing protein, partial [Longimicrobium sp.]|nr:rhodanese-like domain-containing protein [Longimicrobium sp.]
MRTTKQLAAFCLTAALAGCLVYVPPTVEPARGNSEMLVSVEQLSRRLAEANTVVLHVGRDRASYDAGHIPGARFLALSDIVTERDGVPNELPSVDALDQAFEAVGVSDDSRVVLYGDLAGLAAARAFFTLDYLGHTPALLDGGLEAWRAANKEVTTQPTT